MGFIKQLKEYKGKSLDSLITFLKSTNNDYNIYYNELYGMNEINITGSTLIFTIYDDNTVDDLMYYDKYII